MEAARTSCHRCCRAPRQLMPVLTSCTHSVNNASQVQDEKLNIGDKLIGRCKLSLSITIRSNDDLGSGIAELGKALPA